MGASRLRAVGSASQPRELTTQEQARRDWINERRGTQSNNESSPRMAGGLPGIIGLMTRGTIRHRRFNDGPRRDKATQDWIDQLRGIEIQKDHKSTLRSIFGMRTSADRQRYQDRNSWIDEQIRKSREEEEAKRVSAANQPMTEEERRGYLNTEVETRKDIWD